MTKDQLIAAIDELVVKYRKIVKALHDGKEIDLDALGDLDKKRQSILQHVEQFQDKRKRKHGRRNRHKRKN